MSEQTPPEDDRTVVEGQGDAAGPGDMPERIGPYLLIRELGRGGMGTVYLAEQLEPVQRKVALKLIGKRRAGGSAGAMFEVERQMLARMHHPAIAQVFDAGTAEDGRPWFAMEWVRGEPIVEHVDRHGLSTKERLELFIRVCGGIQHAHQQGVIHRDIKPGNVLVTRVDGVSMPGIIDFGVATGIVEQAGRARSDTTDRAGTRGYMSPEMLAGPAAEVDTRTDVYSLGVLLFELLTRQRPPPADNTSALVAIRKGLVGSTGDGDSAGAPALPKAGHLPRELRWILARALAPDRNDRYDSAAALAADLRRYLANEVVEAVPATRRYRWRKFLARNALAASATSLVALAVVAGLVVAIWGLLEARAQADRAEQIAVFTTRMLSSIEPQIAEGQPTPVLDRVLADAAERVRSELTDQPEIRAEIELTIGKVYASIGQNEPARAHLERVLALVDRRQMPAIYLDAAAELGVMEIDEARFDQAEARLQEAESFARRHGSEADRLNLQTILGSLLYERARYHEAIGIYDGLLVQIGPEPAPELRATHIAILSQMAQAWSELHQLDEANQWLEAALAAARAWDDPVGRAKLAGLLNDRGVLLLRQARYAEAETVLREALDRARRLYGDDHPRVIVIYGNLAGAIRQQGGEDKLAASLPFYEQARELAIERYGPDHSQSVAMTYNLGNAYRESGRIDEALAMHHQALAGRDAFPENHLFQGLVHFGLGQSELAAGNLQAARDHLQLAIDRLGELVGEDFLRRVQAMDALADTYQALGKPERASALREQAAALRSDSH